MENPHLSTARSILAGDPVDSQSYLALFNNYLGVAKVLGKDDRQLLGELYRKCPDNVTAITVLSQLHEVPYTFAFHNVAAIDGFIERYPNECIAHALACRKCSVESAFSKVSKPLTQESLIKLLDHAEEEISTPKMLRDRFLLPIAGLAQHLEPVERDAVIKRVVDVPVGKISVSRYVVNDKKKRRRSVAGSAGTVEERAKQHIERRIEWFYELAVLVFEDGYEYAVEAETYLQYGKGSSNEHACHSSILPTLKRRKENTELWQRDKFEEGLYQYEAHHDLASTVALPREYNQADSWIENHGVLRKTAVKTLNNCARGDISPDQALRQFVSDLSSEISSAQQAMEKQDALQLYYDATGGYVEIDVFMSDFLAEHLTDQELRQFEKVHEFVHKPAGEKYDLCWEEDVPEKSRIDVQRLISEKLRAKKYKR